MRCSVCGCEKYVKHGNTSGGKWLFRCSNGHVWATRSTKEPFPIGSSKMKHTTGGV